VRPDKHVGWRSMGLPENPERSLREAMSSLLGRQT
jgi:2,4-dichlorophenol 6-monooxygenase